MSLSNRLSYIFAIALFASACGGGGDGIGGGVIDPPPGGDGGDGGGDGTVGSLSLNVLWQQRAGIARANPRAEFGTDLPDAIRTVRLEFIPEVGQGCCVAVDPRSDLLPDEERRRLFLVSLAPGDATVDIRGYPVDGAPSEGTDLLCEISPSGLGSPCDPDLDATPSFATDPVAVTIIGGILAQAGNLEVPSLPFIFDRDPDEGATLRTPSPIRFTIADGAEDILPNSVGTGISFGGGAETALGVDDLEPCDDTSGSAPDCSEGGILGAAGFFVTSNPAGGAGGPAEIHLSGSNTGVPTQSVDRRYEIDTTPSQVDLIFAMISSVDFGAVDFDVDYSASGATFAASGGAFDVACESILSNAVTAFNDVQNEQTLLVRLAIPGGTSGPVDLVRCTIENFEEVPATTDFVVDVILATDNGGSPITPMPTVAAIRIEAVQ